MLMSDGLIGLDWTELVWCLSLCLFFCLWFFFFWGGRGKGKGERGKAKKRGERKGGWELLLPVLQRMCCNDFFLGYGIEIAFRREGVLWSVGELDSPPRVGGGRGLLTD